jgi:hypothetical protein
VIIIPGYVIALLTFPGIIVHEMAHQLFCRFLGIPVFNVCYFRIARGSAGYVLYEPPRSPWKSLLVGIGPFFINTVVGAILASPAVISVFIFDHPDLLNGFLIWLGFSIAMHAFPSTGDAATIWKSVIEPKGHYLVKTVGLPIIVVIWVGAIGSFFWLNAVYAGLVIVAVPKLVVSLLA